MVASAKNTKSARRLLLLIACAAVFSLPLVTIVYHAVSGLEVDMRATERERQGMVYHRELFDLLISLQVLRGAVNILQHGDQSQYSLVSDARADVGKWIAKVDEVDVRYGVQLGLHDGWISIRSKLPHFMENHSPHSHTEADIEFEAHSAIIADLMQFMEHVVDKSGLNADPYINFNLRANVLYNLSPEIAEVLGRIRGVIGGYLASHHHQPKYWTREQTRELERLYSQIELWDKLMSNRLNRIARMEPEAAIYARYHDRAIQPLFSDFMKQYRHLLDARVTHWTSQTIFHETSEVVEAYDELYDDIVEHFLGVLEQRRAEYALKRKLVIVSCGAGLIGFVAIFIFLFRSLTKTELAEREARHARKTAEQAAAAKSDFLANMSHELRTPMNGVLGMANLLADTNLSNEQRQYVSTITSSGENLLMLLNDILDFSKIEAGVLSLEHIAYSIKDTMLLTANLLKPQAIAKGLELHMECAPDVPDYLWGDPGRMRQVITNLVGNAIKFTQVGHVRLCACMQAQNGSSQLYVSVEDTGIGIPADKLTKIFDKFTQADASVTRKFGGTGLGLAISRQLVGMMGGKMGVESASGKGSTFWFTIPAASASRSDLEMVSEHKTTRAAQENLPPLETAKILLVEDYQVNQVFAEKLLRKFGARHIDMAENGVQAVDKHDTGAYDLIFMDCQMPEMDGYQATQKIRTLEARTKRHTPIIAMTANAMMGDREKCLRAGMDDYLSKPLRIWHLKRVLSAWFTLPARPGLAEAEAKPTMQDPPIDMKQFHIFTEGDAAEEKELSSLFIDQAREMLVILEKSTGGDGFEAWKSAAHRFKGASGNIGAMRLHHLCKNAELHFTADTVKKREILAAIQAETKRVETFLRG